MSSVDHRDPASSRSIELRPCERDDLRAVADIVHTSTTERYSDSFFLQFMGEWKPGFTVATSAGRVVGLLLGNRPNISSARVLILAVRSEERNRGIGVRLMDYFTALTVGEGARFMTLEVRAENVAAQRFYRRLGFSFERVIRAYYTDGADGFLMSKDLSQNGVIA